jgi:hypothetical protein
LPETPRKVRLRWAILLSSCVCLPSQFSTRRTAQQID